MIAVTDPVLVVDDIELNRELLARRLKQADYPVALVSSGEEALEYLGSNPVSIVLLDINLGGLSGLDVLRTIRQTWTAAHLPVVMVTAQDRSQDIVTALDLGADDYVTKPIDYAVALARIRTQLARKDAEERLRASEQRYALAARGANDGLWDWNLTTAAIYYSDRWKSIVGATHTTLEPTPEEWFNRVHPEDLSGLRGLLDEHLQGRVPHFESEHRIRHESGSFRWVRARGLAVLDAEGRPTRLAGSLSDITGAKVADPLTSLPNRVLVLDRLEQLRRGPGIGEGCAILFLDLDGLKVVNESLGQSVGDDLLRAVAGRLQEALEALSSERAAASNSQRLSEPTLARIRNDEFVILLPEVGVFDAMRAADRLQNALAPVFALGGGDVFLTASVGVAMSATEDDCPADLIQNASTAMTRAKGQGKGRVELFDPAMRDKVTERLRLDTSLRLALDRQEFEPFYQPIINLSTGRLSGFEALMRWRHPERGIVMPTEFISAIEDSGLIRAIGRRFFADVCHQLRAWRDTWPEAASISVNVNFAAPQLDESGLVEQMLQVLDETEIDRAQIVVEVTESTAILDLSHAAAVLHQIPRCGGARCARRFRHGFFVAVVHAVPANQRSQARPFIHRRAACSSGNRSRCDSPGAASFAGRHCRRRRNGGAVRAAQVSGLRLCAGISLRQGPGEFRCGPADLPENVLAFRAIGYRRRLERFRRHHPIGDSPLVPVSGAKSSQPACAAGRQTCTRLPSSSVLSRMRYPPSRPTIVATLSAWFDVAPGVVETSTRCRVSSRRPVPVSATLIRT